MAAGDLYRIVDKQTFDGQECVNRYWYRQTFGSGDAQDLGAAFTESMVDAIITIQSDAVEHVGLEIVNIDDAGDFGEYTLGYPYSGANSGEHLPAFVAWGFRLNRTTRGFRNGSKRIAGVLESWQTNGDLASGTPTTAVTAVGLAFAGPITDGGGNTWVPALVRLSELGTVFAYEAVSGSLYVRITTQNSRKR